VFKKYSSVMFAIFILSLLTGCIKIKDKEQSAQKNANVESQQIDSKQIKHQIVSSNKINDFQIQFSWNANDNIKLVKVTEQRQTQIYELPVGNAWPYSIDGNLPKETIKFEFGQLKDGQWQNCETLDIERPADFIIDGEIEYEKVKNDLPNYFRIYFKENSKLITYGKDAEITNPQIFASAGSAIMTWPTGRNATLGENGKDGGHISLKIETLLGELTLDLHGENGGEGHPGPIDPNRNGQPGKNGIESLTVREEYIGYSLSKEAQCLREPTNGTNGYPGLTGTQGYPGMLGGNSGQAKVEISNSLQGHVSVLIRAGNGGLGGLGGRGGIGGPGGQAGKNTYVGDLGMLRPSPCKPAMDGNPGPEGNPGPSGELGLRGQEQSSCLVIGTEKQCSSVSFQI